MIGDLIIWVKEKYKQFKCIHEYKWREYGIEHELLGTCKKCGRLKK